MSSDTRGAVRALAAHAAAAILIIAATAPAAVAQGTPPGPRPGEIETAPIRCWWKSSTSAIRVGERFTLTLTCGVIETSTLTVVAGTSQLDPGGVQLTPFEVVSGTRHDDIVAPPWRYFQYEYQVRLLAEGFFGQDASIPALPVTYSIQAAGGTGAQGRDQSYILPALPMRVLSLVPAGASDIRDASTEGFAPIESRRFRATSATVAGTVLFVFAGALLVLAGARAVGRVRQRTPLAARPLAPLTVLGAASRALARAKADAGQQGWSPEVARRALTALRLVGAVALGRPVAQTIAAPGVQEREGQLAVRQGLLRPRRTLISAAVTAQTIDHALQHGAVGPASRTTLETVREGLQVLSVAAYGRDGELDGAALDRALGACTDAMRRLRLRSVWPMGAFAGGRTSAAGVPVPSLSEERL
jgi:hypothetical protein